MSTPVKLPQLTDIQKATLVTCWESLGDLERWVGWETYKEQVKAELPELYKAWEDCIDSTRRMNVACTKLQTKLAASYANN